MQARVTSTFALATLTMIQAVCSLRAADDVIIYATGGVSGKGQARAIGQIVDYTGRSARIRLASGREQEIPTDRVIEVQSLWTPQQTQGDLLFAEGRFSDAIAQYNEALRIEHRPWVQRKILAQQVWCHRSLGQQDVAAQLFLDLVQRDPATHYFDAIPLVWTTQQPSPATLRLAMPWLESASQPLQTLLAASWLLSSAHRANAISALGRLVSNSDARIVHLAEAQRWRTKIVTASQVDVQRWQRQIDRMPKSLRPGPYYLLGQALSRQKEHEQAALVLMRIPIFYGKDRWLAASALHAAGRELEALERADEAVGLYQEVVNDYAGVPVATDSSIRLRALTEAAP